MHILFLSHYFPPEVNAPASRTYEHCKQWVRDGQEVTVVTCAPNHPRGKVYAGYRNRLFQREERDGIHIVRLWTYVTPNEGFIRRTLGYVSFMLASIVVAPWLKKADVIVTTSPQFFNGLAGYFVSRLKRTPWVLEIRDLWPESIVAVGALTNRFAIRLLSRIELFAYRKADRIVVVTDAFKRYIVAKGIAPRKIEVITNGVDLTLFRQSDGANAVARELALEGKFVASYFGTHGMAHRLETVLHAAEELRGYDDIVFLLVGDGAERDRLVALRDEMQLTNVVMLGQQPKQRMPDLWDLSAVSLALLKKSELFKTVIPSKIFESLAMETPVILGVEGESAEIIRAAAAGFCIEPENSSELAARVLELYRNPKLVARLGANGRRHVEEHYDRMVLARRYEALFSSMLAGPAPAPARSEN